MRHCVKEVDSLFHPKVHWGEDSIFNAPAGVGGKACPTGRVESIHRFHQADGADGNKVVLIAGQGVVFFYDVCHQTQIVPDQFFPCGRVTGTHWTVHRRYCGEKEPGSRLCCRCTV